jgi:outer membrane receptor protein involved in Fe transport
MKLLNQSGTWYTHLGMIPLRPRFFLAVFFWAARAAAEPRLPSTAQADFQFFQEETPSVFVAAKKEESLLGAAGTVYVITEDDIKRYGWRDMKEILMAAPNLDVMWQWNWLNGGQRGFTGNFAGTLLLIDGREVQNILAGEAFMTNNFPAHRIKRVEILQGPNSTLYGGNATQGVINIVTKQGDNGRENLNEVEYLMGDAGTSQVSGLVKKYTEDAELGFSGSYFRSDQDYEELAAFAGDTDKFSRNPVKDSLRYRGKDRFSLPEQCWTTDAYIRHKGLYGGLNYFEQFGTEGLEFVKYDYSGNSARRGYRQAFAGYKHKFTDDLKAFIEFKNVLETEAWTVQSFISGTSYDNLVLNLHSDTIEKTRKNLITAQMDYRPEDRHYIVAGYEWWRVNMDHLLGQENALIPQDVAANIAASWPQDKEITRKHSLFVQDTVQLLPDRLKFTGGLRFNTQDHTNDSWLPRGSLVYQPRPSAALKFTYGKAFRPPNVFEFLGGDAEIASQEMDMYELNYSQNANAGSFYLSNIMAAYHMRVSNLYTQDTTAGSIADWRTVVGGSFHVNGFEESAKLRWSRLSSLFSFRYVDPEDTRVAGQDIDADVPKTKVKLGLSYDLSRRLSAAVFMDHFAETKTDATAPDGASTEVYTVPAFTVAHLNVNLGDFDFAGMTGTLSLYVENLFDKAYYHPNVRGASPVQYLQAPRNVRVKTSMSF